MKNMFIVSVESPKPVSAEDMRLTLTKGFDGYLYPKFRVEEGDHKKIASFVSDYLVAEDALHKYEAEHDIYGQCQSIDSPVGAEWKRLYDDVQTKRNYLVGKLREYGCVV